jgi:hypothetical protein
MKQELRDLGVESIMKYHFEEEDEKIGLAKPSINSEVILLLLIKIILLDVVGNQLC